MILLQLLKFAEQSIILFVRNGELREDVVAVVVLSNGGAKSFGARSSCGEGIALCHGPPLAG